MKTLFRPLPALALLAALSAPSRAMWPFADAKPAGPLGAVLAEVSGPVNVHKAGGAAAVPAAAQTALDAGDTVTTGSGGRAVIAFLDASKMKIQENSSFAVAGHSAKQVSVKIDVGTLQFWITKQAHRRRYQLRTPTAVASVRGTIGEIEVAQNGETNFNLFEGSLGISDSKGNEVRLEANQTVKSDDQTGLQDAKVESLPANKQPEPEPDVKLPPSSTDGQTTDASTDSEGTVEASDPVPTQTTNPAQNQAVSNSTP